MKNIKTKKINLIILFLLSTTGFMSCSNDDDNTSKETVDYLNLYETTFHFDQMGQCSYPNATPCTTTDFNEKIVGHDWEHISTHEIDENGKMKHETFYSDLYGVNPHDFNFETTSEYKVCSFSDAENKNIIITKHYEYNEHTGYIVNLSDSNYQINDIQVVCLGNNGNTLYLLEHLCTQLKGTSYHDIYGLSIYKKND